PDPTPLVLPVLVGVSMWAMQKMSTFPTADPRQAQTNQIMLWMMPIMFAFFTLQFPSGLALYWVVSNLVGIVVQYFITGWGGLLPQKKLQTAPAAIPQGAQPPKELIGDGKSRDERQERRRGRRAGPKAARRKSGGGGDRGSEPR
ncbi:MAG: YidC/Oxa1 family membrane protein insertase, partial [Chloroflexi bacterium]|nr:YidC/Oxa1 family membrane protein insertase [Chloroflexota bacterium]